MPNRYIRAAAIESEPINALSWQAEVFFRRLLNRVDDFGRFYASPKLLRASLFPLQVDVVKEKDVARLLEECVKVGAVFTYTSKTKQELLVVNKWEKGRAKTSEYEAPPADILKKMQTYVYTSKHKSAHAPDSDSDSDTGSDTDSDTDSGSLDPKARPVSAEEVHLYSLTLKPHHGIDLLTESHKFFDHYTARAWKFPDGARMRAWKASFNNWLKGAVERAGKNFVSGDAPPKASGPHGHTGGLEVFNGEPEQPDTAALAPTGGAS